MIILKTAATLVTVTILMFITACSSTNEDRQKNMDSLSEVWGLSSVNIKTRFNTKISHTSTITLRMKLRSVQKPRRQNIAISSFNNNKLGVRIPTRKIFLAWNHQKFVPLMIVTNRASLKKHLVSIVAYKQNGDLVEPEWIWLPFSNKGKNKLWWLAIRKISAENADIKVKLRKTIQTRKGYFSSYKASVPRDSVVPHLSGCIEFPYNMHFSTQIGKGMRVQVLKQPDGRAYGFCYKNGTYNGRAKGKAHFVAVSTATGWPEVAASMHRAFKTSETVNHELLPKIVSKINPAGVKDGSDSTIDKTRRWVFNKLDYSAKESLVNAPRSFDEIVKSGGGVCTDLTLVLTMLLRKEGVVAHPALTSATFIDAFKTNAADLSRLDHMVVYLPKKQWYLDPHKIYPSALLTSTKRQVLDIVTGKVAAVAEAPALTKID